MIKKTPTLRPLTLSLLLPIWVLTVILVSCATPTEPPSTPTRIAKINTATPAPTKTPSPTVTAVRTPPALPEIYIAENLNPVDTPHTYVPDTCEYLKNRWDPVNAKPGTVVMIIMLNDINKGTKPNSSDSITVNQFERMIPEIKRQRFQAINATQLADFLEHNAYIPPRSIVFVQDGRRNGENYERHFRELWEEDGWPVINSWIIQENTTEELTQENLALEEEGLVDHQLYSPLQRFSDNAGTDFLMEELSKFVELFKERYHKTPIAITWPGKPGSNFPSAARGLDFRLGFTANNRGPVMYNWIPLADQEDSDRPAYYPEGSFNDPLMTLPRYWPSQVVNSLDAARWAGEVAVTYAEEHKETELEYYDIVCASEYGEIATTP